MASSAPAGPTIPAGGTAPAHGRLARLVACPRQLFLALYLLALAIDLGFGFAIRFRASPMLLEADEAEYWALAGQILHQTLHWDARRTLAFPLAIAGLRGIADHVLFVQAALAAGFALAAPLLASLVRRTSGSATAGALAGLMLACWPPAIFYGASLYSESLALPMLLATLLALPPGNRLAGAGRTRLVQALGCGVLLGLTTQIRPMYLLFVPVLVAILLIEEARIAVALRRAAMAAIGFAAVILPWSAVMTAHFGHPILVTANGGETLAGGLNPALAAGEHDVLPGIAGRTAWTGPGKWIPIDRTGYLTAAERALPYDRMDGLLRDRTRAWIRAHPIDALRLEACKIGYMWGVYPIGQIGGAQLLFGSLPTLALIAIVLALLARGRVGGVETARFWLLPLFVSGVALISWGSWRFRQAGDAGLIAIAAIGLARLWLVRGRGDRPA